jgi:hypothetical protein
MDLEEIGTSKKVKEQLQVRNLLPYTKIRGDGATPNLRERALANLQKKFENSIKIYCIQRVRRR